MITRILYIIPMPPRPKRVNIIMCLFSATLRLPLFFFAVCDVPPPLAHPRSLPPMCTRDKSTSALLSYSNNATPPRTASPPAHSRPPPAAADATVATSGGGFVGPSGPKLCDGRRRRGASEKMTPNRHGWVQFTFGPPWAIVALAALPVRTK